MPEVIPPDTINFEIFSRSSSDVREIKQRKLREYLKVGRLLSDTGRNEPSKRAQGQKAKELHPEIMELDSALRSNCKWLHEALHCKDHRNDDVLAVLGVTSIFDLSIESPTVIRRRYRVRKKK